MYPNFKVISSVPLRSYSLKKSNRTVIKIKPVLIVDRDRETLKKVSKLINARPNHTKPQKTDFTNEHVNFRDDKEKKINKHLDVLHH